MPNPTLLFYEAGEPLWAQRLRQVCAIQGVRLRSVTNSDLGRTVLALSEGDETGPTQPFAPLPESMLVICHLSGPHLDRLLKSLRKAGVPRTCLKAVLTAENAKWPLHTLWEELVQERAALDPK